MRLPIVDNAERPVELDWLRIQRVHPSPVVRARLEVRRDTRERRRWVHAPRFPGPDPDGEHVDLEELDARLAGELAAAVRVLVESQDPTIDEPPSGDDLRHEVEVSWGGVVHRYVVDGDPTEDALGGVLRLMTGLLDAQPRITGLEPDGPATSR